MFPFDDSDSQTLTERIFGIRRRPVERATYNPLSIVVARPLRRQRTTHTRSSPTAAPPPASPPRPPRAPAPPTLTPAAHELRGFIAFAAKAGVSVSDALALEAERGLERARELVAAHTHAPDPGAAALLAGRAPGVYQQRERAMLEAAVQRADREGLPRPAATPAPAAQTFRGFSDRASIAGVYARREGVMLAAASQRQAEHGESAPPAEAPSTPGAAPRTLEEIDAASVYDRRAAVMDEAAAARQRAREQE